MCKAVQLYLLVQVEGEGEGDTEVEGKCMGGRVWMGGGVNVSLRRGEGGREILAGNGEAEMGMKKFC